MAWYSSPGHIPPELDLEIVEPAMEAETPHLVKRTLVYPVSVMVTSVEPPAPP